jgi:hypothetical protein
MEHNFQIRGNGVDKVFFGDLNRGETRELQIDLKPGLYTVLCPVGCHAEQGMLVHVQAVESCTPKTLTRRERLAQKGRAHAGAYRELSLRLS